MPWKPVEKTCIICGNTFTTAKPKTAIHCSHKCMAVTVVAKRRAKGWTRKTCSEPDCKRPAHGQGICLMHYKRVRNHGSTALTRKRRPHGISNYGWFMVHVEKTRTCWIWHGPILHKRGGYGTFYDTDRGKKVRAHHYLVPRLPTREEADGVKMEYDHLCHNVLCVRPEHLEMVTATENRRRQHRRRVSPHRRQPMNDYRIIHGDGAEALREFEGQADLILTSPPYDNLRDYGGHGFDFGPMADACVAALKEGGVIVWVVADATVDGSETGTSFRQALGFMERGLKLYDTMIYEKNGMAWPHARKYHNVVEYMFVITKGEPETVNLIKDRRNRFTERWSSKETERRPDGSTKQRIRPKQTAEYGTRWNIWRYENGGQGMSAPDFAESYLHPAIFPLALAKDHIRTWTNPGDLVIDPMAGSGTTLRAAVDLGRRAVGMEIHKPYCDLIERRMAQLVLV